MQTRRDRLQAYQYQVKRIMSALLGMEPEAPEQPMRRVRTAMFSGVMIGALACGVVALIGWMSHSQTRGWKDSAPALIQIKETGAQFVYWEDSKNSGEKVLYPVTNFTSAQLILGNDNLNRRTIPRVNTDEVPRGPLVGIEGIPPSLPDAKNVTSGIWNVCNHIETTDGKDSRKVDLLVGQAASSLAFINPQTITVRDTVTGDLYLIYNGKRLKVPSLDTLRVLDLPTDQIVQVRPAWLNALPEGTPLEPMAIPNAGETGTKPVSDEQTVVGQVFNDDDKYYLMTVPGVVEITETQADLLTGLGKARDANGVQTKATEVTSADLLDLVIENGGNAAPADHPGAKPEQYAFSGTNPQLCLGYDSSQPEEPIDVAIGGTLPSTAKVQPIGGTVSGALADRVSLPGGKFALIRSVPGTNTDQGVLYILTDDGMKYPVPDADALTKLGFQGVKPWPVPRAIADMIATGAALDPKKAMGTALAASAPAPSETPAAGN